MAAGRKLQAEIEKVLKKVDEGIEEFNHIWESVHGASHANQREKFEAELKSQIKKLQRDREQIKVWLSDKNIKDKHALGEARKRIEVEMERFQKCERDLKTKQYSKEGLSKSEKVDPHEGERLRHKAWIQECIEKQQVQIDEMDADIESQTVCSSRRSRKKEEKEDSPAILHLRHMQETHRWHTTKLEQLLRKIENDDVDLQEMDDLKENVEYYVDDNSRDPEEFQEFDTIYEGFGLENIEDYLSKDRDKADSKADLMELELDVSSAGDRAESSQGGDKAEKEPHVLKAPTKSVSSSAVSKPAPSTSRKRSSHEDKQEQADSEKQKPASTWPTMANVWQNPTAAMPTEKAPPPPGAPPSSAPPKPGPPSQRMAPSLPPPTRMAQPDRPPPPGQAPVLNSPPNQPPPPKLSMQPPLAPPKPAPHQPPLAPPKPAPHQTPQAPPPAQAPPQPPVPSPPLGSPPRPVHLVPNSLSSIVGVGSMPMPAPPPMPPPTPQDVATPSMSSAAASSIAVSVNEPPASAPPPPPPPVLPPPPPSPVPTPGGPPASRPPASTPSSASTPGVAKKPPPAEREPPQWPPPPAFAGDGLQVITKVPPPMEAPPPPAESPPPPPTPEKQGAGNDVAIPSASAAEVRTPPAHAAGQSSPTAIVTSLEFAGLPPPPSHRQLPMTPTSGTLPSSCVSASASSMPPAPQSQVAGGEVASAPKLDPLSLLAASHRNLPSASDVRRKRKYAPRSPYVHKESRGQPAYPLQPTKNYEIPDMFEKYDLDTLFFIFYYQQGTYQQLLAAKELKKLSWRYHTKYLTWFQRHQEPRQTASDYERGSYVYFDHDSGWCQRIKNDFQFEYLYLEDEPM